jgi:hypothetical protein
MNHQEFSKKGGKSRSKAKMDAMRKNLAKGREKIALRRKSNMVKSSQGLPPLQKKEGIKSKT